MRAIAITLLGLLVACGSPPPPPLPYLGPLPPKTSLDLAGKFTLSPSGELTLELATQCRSGIVAFGMTLQPDSHLGCDRAHLDAIRINAATPWGTQVRGTWIDDRHLSFQVDWKQSGLDPLADNAAAMVSQPWIIASTRWQPSALQARQLLALISSATDTEPDLATGGPAPGLEVAGFEIAEGQLRAGVEATLVVRIVNRGPGTAYRVVASSRSSIAALHHLRMTFGMIKPGGEKVRKLRVLVPVSESSPDTMLVLEIAEGNGFAPRNVSRRFAIQPATTMPVLAVHCAVNGRPSARPDLDAGERIVLHCLVDNTGTRAAKVELVSSVARTAPSRSPIQDVAVGGHATFDIPLTIPRDLAIDSPVEIGVTADDAVSSVSARTSLVGTVRKPKLCTAGQLTRTQYRAKIAELRAAVAAGDLTQAQFDRYDAELVACLQ